MVLPAVRSELASFEVAVRFELLGSKEGVLLDSRGPPAGSYPRNPDVTIAVDARLAHAFWLGETHAPSLLLQGRMVVDGSLERFLGCLPALPTLSQHYRRLVGEPTFTLPSNAVLRDFGVRARHLNRVNAPAYVSATDPHHQALVAATILIGFHPICRRLEIDALVDDFVAEANRTGRPPNTGPLRVLALLGDLAAAGSALELAHANRCMKPEISPREHLRLSPRPAQARHEEESQ
jgi:hypothetical protein